MPHHTPDTLRAALAFISPDIPHGEWIRVAMAIKSELGEAGFDLFDDWSAKGESYDPRGTLTAWRSITADGGVTVGSLFAMAKDAGFRFDETNRPAPLSPEERRELEATQASRIEAERERRRQQHAVVRDKARESWNEAPIEGHSAYLERKGVQGHGIRYLPSSGAILVPLVDLDGTLWSLQLIAPDGAKRFMRDGRVKGLLHWLGDPARGDALVVCEGYATAASLFESAGIPVAMAHSVGNLEEVATGLRARYPDRPIVIAADDDRDTESKRGRNPGIEGARKAAAAARAAMIVPAGLSEGGDFNDMAIAAGGAAVADLIAQGVAAARNILAQPLEPEAASRADDSADGTKAPDPGRKTADRFSVSETGVYFADYKGSEVTWVYVCAPLHVIAISRDALDGSYGYLVEFRDREGKQKRLPIPARLFAGDGNEYRAALLDLGLHVGVARAAREKLAAYIQSRRPEKFVRCVDRLGWNEELGVYVWPDQTFGDCGEEVIYQPEERSRSPFRQAGTLDQWRSAVATMCAGNTRLAFAVSCAFAGPCLRLVGLEGGGFHFRGDSGTGKSTALHVAASVYGGPDFVRTWRSTSNAMEAVAAERNDGLGVFDEISEADSEAVGATVYMLSNGQEKGRKNRTNQLRPQKNWLTLFLSSGEKSLGSLMGEAGQAPRAGQEVRLVELLADAQVPDQFSPGKTLGIFDTLHGEENSQEGGARFSRQLRDRAKTFHGTAGESFLDLLTSDRERCIASLRRRMSQLVKDWIPNRDAGGQVRRVADRFAVVGAAGELASEAGITGWESGEASRAAAALFRAWLAERGSDGAGEEIAIVRQVARVLTERGEANFPYWHRAGDDHRPNASNRWGLRKLIRQLDATSEDSADGKAVGIESNVDFHATYGDKMSPEAAESSVAEFFVMSAPFRAEIAKGYEPRHVAEILHRRGHLVPERSRTGVRLDRKERLPGIGHVRCYRIKPSIFTDELL